MGGGFADSLREAWALVSGFDARLAEIIAATVLCGEISLGSAIVSEEWVKAHDLFGRTRP